MSNAGAFCCSLDQEAPMVFLQGKFCPLSLLRLRLRSCPGGDIARWTDVAWRATEGQNQTAQTKDFKKQGGKMNEAETKMKNAQEKAAKTFKKASERRVEESRVCQIASTSADDFFFFFFLHLAIEHMLSIHRSPGSETEASTWSTGCIHIVNLHSAPSALTNPVAVKGRRCKKKRGGSKEGKD